MNPFRRKRVELFLSFLDTMEVEPVRILDVGGRIDFWKDTPLWNSPRYHITVANIEEDKNIHLLDGDGAPSNIAWKYGNALDLGEDLSGGYDVLFSNSVIEHVGDMPEIEKMARQFTGFHGRYFLQTPNYWFIIEPHFRFPFFAQLPFPVRTLLVRNFNMGYFRKADNWAEAKRKVGEIRLLTYDEVRRLFPDATIVKERWKGLTKSFFVHNFEPAGEAATEQAPASSVQ